MVASLIFLLLLLEAAQETPLDRSKSRKSNELPNSTTAQRPYDYSRQSS
jgi:hypothetical protein